MPQRPFFFSHFSFFLGGLVFSDFCFVTFFPLFFLGGGGGLGSADAPIRRATLSSEDAPVRGRERGPEGKTVGPTNAGGQTAMLAGQKGASQGTCGHKSRAKRRIARKV